MLVLLSLLFILSCHAVPLNRVVVYTSYNVLSSNDIMGCKTSSDNETNIQVNLFQISSSAPSYVLCVTDENGQAHLNNIDINTFGSDIINPGESNIYTISSRSK